MRDTFIARLSLALKRREAISGHCVCPTVSSETEYVVASAEKKGEPAGSCQNSVGGYAANSVEQVMNDPGAQINKSRFPISACQTIPVKRQFNKCVVKS